MCRRTMCFSPRRVQCALRTSRFLRALGQVVRFSSFTSLRRSWRRFNTRLRARATLLPAAWRALTLSEFLLERGSSRSASSSLVHPSPGLCLFRDEGQPGPAARRVAPVPAAWRVLHAGHGHVLVRLPRCSPCLWPVLHRAG